MNSTPATHHGVVNNTATKTTLVIACGAISHELVAVARANRWHHLEIQCLPAHWHNTPEKITPAIEKKLDQHSSQYDRVYIAYADCGTGGQLDALLEKHRIERLPGDHCYGFFSGQAVFDAMAQDELGTFYLTDYLVDHFQQLILDGLGISRYPELLPQYFGHYTRLMYLCQDCQSKKHQRRLRLAQDAADALGLTLQVHNTSLTHFSQALGALDIKVQVVNDVPKNAS